MAMDKSDIELEFGVESDDFCPLTKDNKHVPDPATLSVAWDEGEAYIDVNCKACGRSGCCGKFDPEQVAW